MIDQVEALLLSSFVGKVLDATVVSIEKVATVAIADPVVVTASSAAPGWEPGDAVRVSVDAVDVDARHISLSPA